MYSLSKCRELLVGGLDLIVIVRLRAGDYSILLASEDQVLLIQLLITRLSVGRDGRCREGRRLKLCYGIAHFRIKKSGKSAIPCQVFTVAIYISLEGIRMITIRIALITLCSPDMVPRCTRLIYKAIFQSHKSLSHGFRFFYLLLSAQK